MTQVYRQIRDIDKQLTKTILNISKGDGSTSTDAKLLPYLEAGFTVQKLTEIDETYKVIWPWNLQYHELRLSVNKRIQNFPILIVFPWTTEQVSEWVKLCTEHKLTLSVRSGGSNSEGLSSSKQVILDLRELTTENDDSMIYSSKTTHVDICAGVKLKAVYKSLAEDKQRTIIDSCNLDGCIGVKAGGIGYLVRRYGFACDNLVDAEIVLSDGKVMMTSQDPDLLKAIKGAGGGNFGIITKYRLKTYDLPQVISFSYSFLISELEDVMRKWQWYIGIVSKISGLVTHCIAGEETFIVNGIFIPTMSGDSAMNEFKTIISGFLETLKKSSIRPIDEEINPCSYYDFLKGAYEDRKPLPFFQSKSRYIKAPGLGMEGWQTILNLLTESFRIDRTKAMLVLNIDSLPPTSSIIKDEAVETKDDSVIAWRQQSMMILKATAMWKYQEDEKDICAKLETFMNAVHKLENVCGSDPSVADLSLGDHMEAYYGSHTEFLRNLKEKYDPTHLFSSPLSIAPPLRITVPDMSSPEPLSGSPIEFEGEPIVFPKVGPLTV